jgi:hypothetical protein
MLEKNCLGLKNERKRIPLPCDKKGRLICNDKKIFRKLFVSMEFGTNHRLGVLKHLVGDISLKRKNLKKYMYGTLIKTHHSVFLYSDMLLLFIEKSVYKTKQILLDSYTMHFLL